jgi:L-ascorbate metabolism protein UlaG (beta-lactamase superfamily)
VTFVGHATMLIEVAGRRILTDPLLTGRVTFIRRIVDPVPTGTALDLDMVLLSHLHQDHLHVPSLRRISRRTPVVVPKGGAYAARRGGFDDIVEVVAGDRLDLDGVTISVVPALHSGRRWPVGRSAEPVGYVVESNRGQRSRRLLKPGGTGGFSCYFAGDTDVFDDMADLRGTVDLALLPVWGWGPTAGHGHLDPARAAAAVDIIRPTSVVPIHWGTLWPSGLGRYRRDRLVEPPHELAESLERLGVVTDLRVLAPGGAFDEPG